jgi:hypothetical protein
MIMKKYIQTLIIIALPLLFASCLKEEGVFQENGSYGIVELVLPARTTSTPFSVKNTAIALQDEFILTITVNYTGVNGAPEDVQVTLAIDDVAVATQYPNGSVEALPDNFYEIPASNTVTIPRGGKTATYAIKLKPNLFDPDKAYALGVKISRASVGAVSGNYSTGIYRLLVD